MKRYIRSNHGVAYTEAQKNMILETLHKYHLDTKEHAYKLRLLRFNGEGYWKPYSVDLISLHAPGDFLSYFSLRIHGSVTFGDLAKYWDYKDVIRILEKYRSVDKFANSPEIFEWSCSDNNDRVEYLRNIDTKKTLFEIEKLEEDDFREYEDDSWDW